MYHDLIIIGGGSCGMASAIKSKDLGIDVCIIDGSDRLGKKLLTTGNGRCNLTNEDLTLDRFHSDNIDFFKPIISKFNLHDSINFFNSIGLYTCVLDSKKIYPISLQASSVVDIFRINLSERDIPIYMNSKVLNITKDKNNLFNITTDSNTYTCKKVLLCTGGKSYTKSGSDGSGYKLAKNFGHKIVPTTPGIVQLKLKYDKLKAISGVKFQSFCSISINNETLRQEFGEILFTDYGISGPPVLQLSRIASRGVLNNNSVYLHVNLMNLNYDDILSFFESHFAVFSSRSISDNLIGIINKKLIPIILKEVGIIDIHMTTYDIDYEQRYKLYRLLSNWTFKVMDTNPFENAQVTLGGIDTTDVDNLTLESTLVPGLYFAGEILDVDGDCGGFNLQWCWSSSSAVTESINAALTK